MSRPALMLTAYVALAVVHVLSRLLELPGLATATKPLLMPVLAAYLLLATAPPRSRLVRLALVALAFSWLGDVLLMGSGDAFFLGGLGAFLVAQICYVAAFLPVVRARPSGRPPLLALLYVPYGAVLVGVLGPDLGVLLLPVAVYAVAICLMAIAAAGVNVWAAVGAASFLLSDSLIALTRLTDVLEPAAPVREALIMSTYTLGQGLIIVGVVLAQRAAAAAGEVPATAGR